MKRSVNHDDEYDVFDLIGVSVLEFSSHSAMTLTALFSPFGIQNGKMDLDLTAHDERDLSTRFRNLPLEDLSGFAGGSCRANCRAWTSRETAQVEVRISAKLPIRNLWIFSAEVEIRGHNRDLFKKWRTPWRLGSTAWT